MSTNTNTEVTTTTTTEAIVDPGFVKVFANVDKVANSLGGKWASVAEYVIEQSLTRDVVLASLKSMGKKTETAQSITSRIMDMVKPENQWKLAKMKSGDLSVRDARSATIKLAEDGQTIVRTAPPARPASVRLADFLTSAANVAVTENIDEETFVQRATEAFQASKSLKAAKK